MPSRQALRGDETVLVVDDDDRVRAVTRRALSLYGYRVLEAADASAALALLADRAGEISLVITDLSLPAIGGRELAARIRELRPSLPVLFTSGADAGDAPGAVRPFLPKPYRPTELVTRVRALLDAR